MLGPTGDAREHRRTGLNRQSWDESRSLAVFGWVLREDFGPDSNIDVLVRFDHQARHTLLDIGHMENELSRMLGRDVNLLERMAVKRCRIHIRRKAILDSAETIDES